MIEITYTSLQKKIKPFKEAGKTEINIRKASFNELAQEWFRLTGEKVERLKGSKPTSGNRNPTMTDEFRKHSFKRNPDLKEDSERIGKLIFSIRLPEDVEQAFVTGYDKDQKPIKDFCRLRKIIVDAVRAS
jgi:hypothetical protein